MPEESQSVSTGWASPSAPADDEVVQRWQEFHRLEKEARATVARLQSMKERWKQKLGPFLWPRRDWRTRMRERLKKLAGIRIGTLAHYAPRTLWLPKHYHIAPKLTDPPAIAIVTPSYNQGPFVEATIRSVLEQDYPRLQYVVQDGGSDDETVMVLDRYRPRLWHCESRPDNGQAQAVNLGFSHTDGEVMAWLNSDDLLLPGALHYVAKWFLNHPDVDVVYGHRVLINEDGMEIGRWVLPRHDNDVTLWADYVPQETLFWRRRIWERVGSKLDESFQFAMDWELLLRFREAGARFARLPRFLGAFRTHWRQKTMALMENQGKSDMDRLRLRFHGRRVTRLEIRRATLPYLLKHAFHHQMYRLGLFRY